MRLRSTGFPAVLIIALFCSIAGCSGGGKDKLEAHPVVRGLALEKVAVVSIPERVEVAGTVRAKNSARLAARIPGTVSAVHVREGDRVGRGTLLISLDARESMAGAVGAANAVEEALARKKLADVTYERFSRLFAENSVSRQELDTKRAERDVADRALARTREAASAAAAVAGYARITSPVSGVVTSRLVDPGSTVFPGMPMMTVEGEGSYRLEAAVPESLLGKISMDAVVPVSIDGVGDGRTGRVVEIVPAVDPASRTFTVKLEILSTGARSGRFGRAWLPVGEKPGIAAPKSAVMERGQLSFVWVVDVGNIARMRLVKPGAVQSGRIEILAGLAAGERIVVGGMDKVTDGAKVE
jgi:membrane fusion protein, multidrug efflux system